MKDRIDEAFNEAVLLRPLVQAEYGLTAPNHYDRLTPDDYLLATRVTKYVATDLCRIAAPSTGAEIIALLRTKEETLAMLAHNRTSDRKLTRSLRNWLRSDYFFLVEEHPEIEKVVLTWIRDLLSRRERRRQKLGNLKTYVDGLDAVPA